MAIAGLRGTGDWGADERPKSFREKILWLRPSGDSPIFALTGKAKKKKVTDPEFFWWNEGETLVRLQVNGALNSTDTLVTVDSSDPSNAATLGGLYGSALNLKEGDLLLVEPVSDNATFNHELIQVDSVLSAQQFNVRRGAGGTTPANIGNDVYLTLIGSAYAEGTGVPRATSRNPIKFGNKTQIFKDTYELTGTADKTEVRTGEPWSMDKKRKAYDHSRAIEMAFLFGRQSETVGDNGKPKRTMGGLREFIPASNTTVFGNTVDVNELIDAVAPVFEYSTGAGDTRIMFTGNAALIAMSKFVNKEFQWNTTGPVKLYGMNFRELILPTGRLLVRSHPLLSAHPMYRNSAFVLDFDAIEYVYLDGRDTKAKDDVQAEDEDVRRGFYQTECSLAVDYAGLTMAYLGNITPDLT